MEISDTHNHLTWAPTCG